MKQILILLISFSAYFVTAQEMEMEGYGPMASSSVNIYLLMMDTMMEKMAIVPVTAIPDHDFMAQMENKVRVFDVNKDFAQIDTINVGALPHGLGLLQMENVCL